jgi:hypothetical protein
VRVALVVLGAQADTRHHRARTLLAFGLARAWC